MYLEDVKTTIDIIKEATKQVKSGYTTDVVKYLKEYIREEEEKIAKQLKEESTITLEDAPTYAMFCNWVEDILHDRLTEETPHGEYGGDISGVFYWNNKEWDCNYDPDWNRHDKQYYFIDNWGNDALTVKEILKEEL